MKKVITYGTFDLLHHGHVNLLRRAKELGDYLIVGVTSSDFDKNRGKINVKQSLMDRIEAVKALGIADEVHKESREEQKEAQLMEKKTISAGIWCRSALCAAMTRITARSRPFWIPVSWASG